MEDLTAIHPHCHEGGQEEKATLLINLSAHDQVQSGEQPDKRILITSDC